MLTDFFECRKLSTSVRRLSSLLCWNKWESWFQQDGQKLLLRSRQQPYFGTCYAAKMSACLWPPRSPDFAEFFLWGFLTERCYINKPRSQKDIKHAVTGIDRKILRRFSNNWMKNVNVYVKDISGLVMRPKCRRAFGHHDLRTSLNSFCGDFLQKDAI